MACVIAGAVVLVGGMALTLALMLTGADKPRVAENVGLWAGLFLWFVSSLTILLHWAFVEEWRTRDPYAEYAERYFHG